MKRYGHEKSSIASRVRNVSPSNESEPTPTPSPVHKNRIGVREGVGRPLRAARPRCERRGVELAGAGGRRASVTAETEKRAEGVEGRESLLSPRPHLPRCLPWIYAPQSHRRVPPAMPPRRPGRRRRHCVCRGVAGQLAGARGLGWRTPWSAPLRRHTASHGSRVCKGRQVHAGSRGIPQCSFAMRNVVPGEHATACRMRRQKHSTQVLH